jgi:hypothetical protein
MRPLVYVSSPYTATSEQLMAVNTQRAITYGAQVRDTGATPLVPHVSIIPFPGLSAKEAWGPAMQDCLTMLSRSDAMLLCPGWEESRGCRMELIQAEQWQIPVFYNIQDLRAWVEKSA